MKAHQVICAGGLFQGLLEYQINERIPPQERGFYTVGGSKINIFNMLVEGKEQQLNIFDNLWRGVGPSGNFFILGGSHFLQPTCSISHGTSLSPWSH